MLSLGNCVGRRPGQSAIRSRSGPNRAFARATLLTAFCVLAPNLTSAQPLSVEKAFSRDGIVSMRLSPDARHLVALVHAGGGGGLGVVLIDADTLASRFLIRPVDERVGPRGAFWVTSQIVAINDARQRGYLLDLRDMRHRPLRGVFMRNVRRSAEGHPRILVRRDRDHFDRLDIETGDSTPMNFDIPGQFPSGYVVDRDGVPLVVTTVNESVLTADGTVTHWYRSSLDAKWEKLATFPASRVQWQPLLILHDGKSIAVTSEVGRDTRAIFRYDVALRHVEDVLAGHPTQDIGVRSDDGDDDEFVAATTFGMRPQTYWFEPRHAALQRALDAALPDTVNIMTSGPVDKAVLAYSYSDVDPGRWYILDTKTMSVRPVGGRKPSLDPSAMSPTQIVSYSSFDGLEIPAYLTRPKDAKGAGPAVLVIHGGPVARDFWQWDPRVQLLASRGYTVLQPQFRGSAGFGKQFREAGYGQWGLAMQDDVTAGARWLVEQGYADAGRMCIYGGSYGGYAVLSALVKTPHLFKCGISLAGVSDLKALMTGNTDVNDFKSSSEIQRLWIGDPRQQDLDTVSPLNNVAAIEAPLLIAHGDRDRRVPIDQSRDMVSAMRKQGKAVTWLLLQDEGHSLAIARNQRALFDATFDLLDRTIGSGIAVPASSASAPPR